MDDGKAMKYVCVLPYAYKPYYDEFIKTCKIPLKNILFIDNTEKNIGIMKAHNLGIKFMREKNADWLIVMSACLRFGEPGGMDFIKIIEKNPKALMIHGAGRWEHEGEVKTIALGWHLTAFNKKVFEAVGGWDENFTPYSLDDVDLTMRIQKHFGKYYDLRVFPCDFEHASTSHSITLAGVKASFLPRHEYFKRKWGKEASDWQNDGYATPFNLKKPLSYCPVEHDFLSIWQNEYLAGGYNFND